jgi:guanylate kinase
MSLLFVVGAPSGAGKTTLLRRLLERPLGLRFSVSHTTRPRRPGEEEGRDYHFVARDEFLRMREAGEFLEWAEVYGNLYGTHRSELERARKDGVDLLLDVDVQGARSIRAAEVEAVFLLIFPPSWPDLERRLRARGTDSEETIARRLALARAQLVAYRTYDYAVVNDELEGAVRALESIVTAERLRVARQEEGLRALLAS